VTRCGGIGSSGPRACGPRHPTSTGRRPQHRTARRARTPATATTQRRANRQILCAEVAVIDHGRIVAEGTAAALRQQTGGRTLEDAFIALTGHSIREAEATPIDRMRMMRGGGSAAGERRLRPVAAAIEAVFPLARPHDRLAQVAAKHQSLLHFVGNAPWSDAAMLAKVGELVLPAIERWY
jgi:hypothetical protein